MASGNFNKLYNALVYRPIIVHLIIILKLTHLHNRLLSGSNAWHFSNLNGKSVQLKCFPLQTSIPSSVQNG